MYQFFRSSVLRRCLAMVFTVTVLCLMLTACGNRLSGSYLVDNPKDPSVYFTVLHFHGSNVTVESAGNSVVVKYQIKGDTFVIKENYTLTMNGRNVPKIMKFVKSSDGTFSLDGILYKPIY